LKNKLIIVIVFTVSFGEIGCKKFVQIDPPTTQLVAASVFDNDAAATATQVAIYSNMAFNGESTNLEIQTGLLSDELQTYNLGLTYLQFYQNAMLAVNNPGPWSNAYNYIYQANAIIAAIEGGSSLTPNISKQLLGESKFVRAFWLFYLTNLYGDIPLVITTDYTINAVLSKAARSKVYQQIILDLKDAKALLNKSYVDGSDTAVTLTDRTRPNEGAAGAMLARAYLYSGDYQHAELEADSVIGNSLYSLIPNLDSVFLADSHEAIWQLGIPQPSTINTPDAQSFVLTSAPGGVNCCAISQDLVNSFESGDRRRANWIDSIVKNNTTYYFPYKYKVIIGPPVLEDVMVLRLAEQYLIRAEARASQGNLAGSSADLNVVRNRAGLPNISDSIASSKQNLLLAILQERRVELFTEWGHRWFDLIRTGSADSVMSRVTPLKGGTWSTDEHQLLYPIPILDIGKDVNLVQNNGY